MSSAPSPSPPPATREVEAIVALSDPVIRNLRITECYHRLSAAMAARTVGPGANWCTFATWASKQAGQTIRGEDFFQHLPIHGWSLLHPIQSVWRLLLRRGIFNPATRLGRIVRAIHSPFDAFERASAAVARGNQKVFEEIGWEFARYLETCTPDAPPASAGFATFLARLRPGPPPDGQDLLRDAFTHYQQHRSEPSPSRRAQLLLVANLKIGLHEQTRLQPEIQGSLDAAMDTAKNLRERTFLGWLFGFFIRKYAEWARAVTRRAITDALMVLTLPEATLRLGAHLPVAFASDLARLDEPLARDLWDQFEPNRPECADCGAHDWAVLAERMHYIMHLFRCYHADPALMEPPFTAAQVASLLQGRIPDGQL